MSATDDADLVDITLHDMSLEAYRHSTEHHDDTSDHVEVPEVHTV